MKTHFDGQCPFYEVWYGKFNFDKDKAFWFRYTLENGLTQESALWAIFFNGSTIVAQKKAFPLSEIKLENKFTLPLGTLDDQALNGHLDGMQWMLTFQHKNEAFDPVPLLLKKLHLTKSLTQTPITNARFQGSINVRGTTYEIKNSPRMIGHVWGKKQALEWTWCHCNQFLSSDDVVFEGLSARIPILKWPSPPLTSLYIKYNGKIHLLNTLYNLITTRSTYGCGLWKFAAKNRDINLTGTASTRPEHIAVITYTDTDGSQLYCHNSKLADLELCVEEFKTGHTYIFKSDKKAALEWVTRSGFQGTQYL